MAIRSVFDVGKALEVLLYIAARCPDIATAVKVLYFADREHLSRYGRQICGDSYFKLPWGIVPSHTYDLVKFVRGDGMHAFDPSVLKAFSVDRSANRIVPHRDADLDWLSPSDRECLDEAIERCRDKSFIEVHELSLDDASRAAAPDGSIPLEAIVKTLPDSELLLEYLLET